MSDMSAEELRDRIKEALRWRPGPIEPGEQLLDEITDHVMRKLAGIPGGESYGTYRGQPLPPPGREHIIVRTPNPLPTPKKVG